MRHLISWDDYDRYRKVPAGVAGIDESWAEHIGKPLTAVPAPAGSAYPNWAEHFKAAMTEALAALGVEYDGISQTTQYTSGVYREQILHAMRHRGDIDAILAQYRTKKAPGKKSQKPVDEAELEAAEGSGAAAEDDGTTAGGGYYPYKPYCTVCNKDLTTVTSYDDETTELAYTCACGHAETVKLSAFDHGKLVWKVDWPMRWAYEGVIFEPSGVDHSSPGSSFQVGGQIVEIFDGVQPIGPMYAFVGISGMAKMSSSKGGVPTPADALRIMEPQLLRWLYARRRPNQSFKIAFDQEIQRLYDEWDKLEAKVAEGTALPADAAAHSRAAATAAGELPRTPAGCRTARWPRSPTSPPAPRTRPCASSASWTPPARSPAWTRSAPGSTAPRRGSTPASTPRPAPSSAPSQTPRRWPASATRRASRCASSSTASTATGRSTG